MNPVHRRRMTAVSASCGAFMVALVQADAALAQSAEQMVGRWGLAAYFRAADAELVTRAARNACGAPYIIARGPNGGVMLNQPDQPAKSEHVIKSSWGGQTYVGPAGEAGGAKDRAFVSFAPNQFVLRWVDPTVGNRYGVMVFVRCGGR
jgi:hypothetical protein